MFQRSLQASLLGSSLRSDLDMDDRDRGSISSRCRRLEDLLTLLPPSETCFDIDNVSETSGDISVTSHPFSDDTPRCSLDSEVMGQFSSIHEQVMGELRTQPDDVSDLCSTCTTCDTCSTDTWEALGMSEARVARVPPRPLPDRLEQWIQDRLRSVELPRERTGMEKTSTPEGEPRRARKQVPEDNMEGLWNMLATYDEFVVSPPGFNIYQQEKPHWLDQEQIPWEIREKARSKCAKWLKQYHM